jgi:hypothetical protein
MAPDGKNAGWGPEPIRLLPVTLKKTLSWAAFLLAGEGFGLGEIRT